MIFSSFVPTIHEEPDIERMMNEYGDRLMRVCYLYLKDYHLAQEAVQDVFLKAYTKYSTFRRASSEKTWILKIAVNVCRDYLRRPEAREYVDSDTVTLAAERQSTAYTTYDSIELLNLVYSLPVEYKEVVLLRYYQGLPVKEIAKILHQKPNTISVRVKRALILLRQDTSFGK